MSDERYPFRTHARLREHRSQARDDTGRNPFGSGMRGGNLDGGDDALRSGFDRHDVGKRAADVDADAQRVHCGRGWAEGTNGAPSAIVNSALSRSTTKV